IRDRLVTGVQTCALPISPDSQWLIDRRGPPVANIELAGHQPLAAKGTSAAHRFIEHRGQHASVQHAREPLESLRWHVVRDNAVRSEEHTSELQSLAYLVC